MTRLSADILELAAVLLGDGRADVVITADGRAQLLPVLREMADRACKMELDLACLEAVAAEIDPLMLTHAAGDAVLVESDAELAAREAEEQAARRLPPGGLRALDDDDPLLRALRDNAHAASPNADREDDDATITAIIEGIDDGKIVMLSSLRRRCGNVISETPGGAA